MSESRLHAQKLAQPGGQGPISRGCLSNFFNPWLTNPLRNDILSANCDEEKTHEPTNSSTSKIDFEAKPEEILNSTKESFNSEGAKKHPKENPQTFRCLQCPLISETSSAWIDHQKLHAKLLEEGVREYFKKSCNSDVKESKCLSSYEAEDDSKVCSDTTYAEIADVNDTVIKPISNLEKLDESTIIYATVYEKANDIKKDANLRSSDDSSDDEEILNTYLEVKRGQRYLKKKTQWLNPVENEDSGIKLKLDKNQRIPKRKIQWQNPVKSHIVNELTDRKWREPRTELAKLVAKEKHAKFKQRRTKSWVELVRNCHQIHICSSNEPRVIDQVRSETKSMSAVNGE